MSFIHSSAFAYVKNLVIGLGAAIVLVGALFKIQSWPGASEMLTVGLLTEAGLFTMLGLLPPHKDYYWEKLYPGLDQHGGELDGAGGEGGSNVGEAVEKLANSVGSINLNTDPLEKQQQQMVGELKKMADSMGGLQAFMNTDYSEIENLTKGAGKFATAVNEAITSISESLEDTKVYKEQLTELNQNLASLNQVYGGVLAAMGRG